MPSRVVSACVFLALLIPSVTSQLAGCADVACPPAATPGGTHECQIGNSTLTSIGVASIDSKISTQPLTWTLGFEWVNETIQDLKYLLHRSLYLGTEPSLNLGDDQSYGGCALIFEGVASMLRFSANTEAKDWTCPNAMGSQCVDDLNLLAQREFENIDKNASASICTALGTVLQDKVPKSCSGVAGSSSWENIISRGLTGSSYPGAIEQENCQPSTGKDYEVSLIAGYQILAEPTAKALKNAVESVTPIMTMFYPVNGSNSSSLGPLKELETALSCLRPVLYPMEEEAKGESGSGVKAGKASAAEGNLILSVILAFLTIVTYLF